MSHLAKAAILACRLDKSWESPLTAKNAWTPNSWRQFPIKHQPEYADTKALESVHQQIKKLPPLVFAGEIQSEDVVYNAEIHLNGQIAYNEYREKYDIDATGSYYFRLNRLWWGLELSYNGVKVNQLGLGLKVFHDPLTNSTSESLFYNVLYNSNSA